MTELDKLIEEETKDIREYLLNILEWSLQAGLEGKF